MVKLAVLSLNPHLYSTARLVDAAVDRGHDVQVVNYLRCTMDITSKKPSVVYSGDRLRPEAVIPRIGATYTFYGAAVVRQFEVMGVPTANTSDAIARSRDKLRALQLLAHEGIGLPVTGFAHDVRDIDELVKIVSGAPLIVKLLEGTQGRGVVLAETRKAAESVIGAFRQLDANILVQEYVEADARDVRAFVVGGEVVAAMERTAPDGEFRANLHRGGTAEPIELSADDQALAIRAADVLGLGVAGVDMLPTDDGYVVIEVNSSPGLEGIETSSGVDVAEAIIRYAEGLQA
ncbi:MAG: 30S ribosomal protein S6--L-glutamate ligase [Acidimicrobiia bacterium]|nr:30S ribosomal protein S6--L-glutamate ligase [Acidimicrobiia bacterium]